MKYILIAFLGLVTQDPPSQIIIKVSDYQGKKTKSKIEIYQKNRLILSKMANGNYQTQLPKGNYKLKIIACDTVMASIKVWNKEHEYQVSVETNCDKS